ncbi:Polysaccharide biosynthesis protein [Pseudodesulfovibrio hydrargyri]|uniref:Polysaccharide biosynthesis protein n=1 Tax=Pseudodesulfovibrio hydrargyri TaxID=2125990 RepID=A0A1J5MRA7_9BACT|nr:oligosaccharide flippase family protein [Pseudodesulfovibrio hydrargyri]OIQ49141.1 Polysaccharide biosynthesis protein [Pseudodesulfovibrio hydrargyri]
MISVHRLLARNTIASFLRHFINLGILFYLTPFTIAAIGDLQYGLWAVVLTVAGYSGLLDMGITTATTKLAAEYRSKGELDELNELITSSISLFTLFGAACLVAIMLFMPRYIASIDHGALGSESPLAISALIGIDILFVFVANIFTGIILSFHQFHMKSLIDITLGVLKLIATIVVLNAGYGLLGLAVVKLSVSVLSTIALYMVFKRQMPTHKLRLRMPAPAQMKRLINLGGKLFYMTLAIRLVDKTSPIIIVSTIGTIWNAYNSVVNRLATYGNEIVYSTTAAFMPVFSELYAQDDDGTARGLYLQYTRYVIALSMPIFFGVMVLGPDFVGVWIDPVYKEKGGAALRFLAGSFAIVGLQPLLGRLVIGRGDVGFYTKTMTIGLVLNILLSIPACYLGGITALAALSTVASLCFFSIFTVYLSRSFHISITDQLLRCYLKLAPPIAVFLLAFFLIDDRLPSNSYADVFLKAAILVAAYVPVAFVTMLSANERSRIWRMVVLRGRQAG